MYRLPEDNKKQACKITEATAKHTHFWISDEGDVVAPKQTSLQLIETTTLTLSNCETICEQMFKKNLKIYLNHLHKSAISQLQNKKGFYHVNAKHTVQNVKNCLFISVCFFK